MYPAGSATPSKATHLRSRTGLTAGRQSGFTLIEVLIAITITGLIGVGTYQLFSSTLRTQEVMERRSTELEQLQRTMAFITRDFQQLAPRPIRNEYGDSEFSISNRNSLYFIELSRIGWRNPLGELRADIQRVQYELQDNQLYRNYFRILDRAQDSQPVRQRLLDRVETLQVRFMDEKNQWHEEWPADSIMNSGNLEQRLAALPKAVEIQMTHEIFGRITRLFEVADYYQVAKQNRGTNPGNTSNGGNPNGSGGAGQNGQGGGNNGLNITPGSGSGNVESGF